jgi:hypothetical protein
MQEAKLKPLQQREEIPEFYPALQDVSERSGRLLPDAGWPRWPSALVWGTWLAINCFLRRRTLPHHTVVDHFFRRTNASLDAFALCLAL